MGKRDPYFVYTAQFDETFVVGFEERNYLIERGLISYLIEFYGMAATLIWSGVRVPCNVRRFPSFPALKKEAFRMGGTSCNKRSHSFLVYWPWQRLNEAI